MTASDVALPDDYGSTLQALKVRVLEARTTVQRTVNTQLIELYWSICRDVLLRQEQDGWGSRVIARLADDLRREFPDMTGFSPRNLQYMATFARQWPGESIAPQTVAQLPWGHIRTILDKNLGPDARLVRGGRRGVRVVQERADEHDHEQVDGAYRYGAVELQPQPAGRRL